MESSPVFLLCLYGFFKLIASYFCRSVYFSIPFLSYLCIM
nr:MAG TPA: hypothetical protein [Caudoviricetes sp.]